MRREVRRRGVRRERVGFEADGGGPEAEDSRPLGMVETDREQADAADRSRAFRGGRTRPLRGPGRLTASVRRQRTREGLRAAA